MRKLLLCFLAAYGMNAWAAPDLIGRWQSDRELTVDFIRDNTRRTDKQLKALFQIFGNLMLTFDGHSLKQVMQERKFSLEGETYTWAGDETEAPYRVIFNGENIIVIVTEDPEGKEVPVTLNFDGADTMWIYPDYAGSPVQDQHIREYFRRIAD